MLLDTLPLHAIKDFGMDNDAPEMLEYNQCRLCPICGTLIKNDSRYCHKHAKMLDYLRPKIDRLIQRARQRRGDRSELAGAEDSHHHTGRRP